MTQQASVLSEVYAAATQVFGRENPHPTQLARDVNDYITALTCYGQREVIAQARCEAVLFRGTLEVVKQSRAWRGVEPKLVFWISRAVVVRDIRLAWYLTDRRQEIIEKASVANCDRAGVEAVQEFLDGYVAVLDSIEEELERQVQAIEGDIVPIGAVAGA